MIINPKFFHVAVFLMLSLSVTAQPSLQDFLNSIETHNKSLQTAKEYTQMQQLAARTELNPGNPEVEFGYFPGNTDAIGTKQVLGVSQSLEFPTAYLHKYRMANQEVKLHSLNYQLTRQQLLLSAAETWCKLVYLNGKRAMVNQRSSQATQLVDFYRKKQASGDATQLEVNKAQLFAVKMQNQLRLLQGQVLQVNEQITQLNGGTPLLITDSVFAIQDLESWEVLKVAIDSLHPLIQLTALSEQMATSQIKLSRSQALPNLMVGYESETILSDKFQGIKAGISIPLWQDKNKIKRSKAQLLYSQAQKEQAVLALFTDYHNRYIEAQSLFTNSGELKGSLTSMNNQHLLSRSLELGQISAIEYFIELDYFYEMLDQLYELELQYQLSWLRLHEFTL
ncbi:MAG: TolC family protein [Salinivirgaceae bacterium]